MSGPSLLSVASAGALALVLAAPACSRSQPASSTPGGTKATGEPRGAADPSCGGFDRMPWASAPVALMGDHLRITPVAGLVPLARSHDIMGAPPPDEAETRLFLEEDGRKLVVFAFELDRTPGADVESEVRAFASLDGFAIARRKLDSGLEVVFATPPGLTADGEAVLVDSAFALHPDGTMQWIQVFINPAVDPKPGCPALVRRMLESLAAGERTLPLAGGPRELGDGIVLDVPPDHTLVTEDGPDFTVHRLSPLLPLGQSHASLGIYVGHHPSWGPDSSAETRPTTLLGKPVVWHRWKDGDVTQVEALVELDEAVVHVFINASDDALADRLVEVAERRLRR